MDVLQEYFPTKSIKRAEARLSSILYKEQARLDKISLDLNRKKAITQENLLIELPFILEFTASYHEAFMEFLKAALPQHQVKIKCGPHCGNCCHHYPMSIAPFELISFYAKIRESEALFTYMNACFFRVEKFQSLLEKLKNEKSNEEQDLEELALHSFYEAWHACPFIKTNESCNVYSYRPVTCRMYFSETSPEYCVPKHLQTPLNRSFIVYLPDAIEEAIDEITKHYEDLNLSESLYEGLLQMNALEGKVFYGAV
jgi:Fe-S-cluster containining protein